MKKYLLDMENKIALFVGLALFLIVHQVSITASIIYLVLVSVYMFFELKEYKEKDGVFEIATIYPYVKNLRIFADPIIKNKFNEFEIKFIQEKLSFMRADLETEVKNIDLKNDIKQYMIWIEENSCKSQDKNNCNIVSKKRKYQFILTVNCLIDGNNRKALWELLEFINKEGLKGLNDLEIIALINLIDLFLFSLSLETTLKKET